MDNQGIECHEIIDCYLCGSRGKLVYCDLRDHLFASSGVWSLCQCQVCGLVWLNPKPLSEEIWKLYTTYFTHDKNTEGFNPQGFFAEICRVVLKKLDNLLYGPNKYPCSVCETLLGRIFKMIYVQRVNHRLRYLSTVTPGRLLDVGCGDGEWLTLMQRLGWQVRGVEPDPAAAQVAEKRGIPVTVGSIEEASFKDAAFDVITINHVIEHVSEPVKALNVAVNLLKPGGLLIVITPNLGSLSYRWWRKSWIGLDPPRHFFLFNAGTLKRCVSLAGLDTYKIKSCSYSAAWNWRWSKYISRWRRIHLMEENGHRHSLHVEGNPVFSYAEGLIFRLLEGTVNSFSKFVGEDLVLVAQKPD